MRHGVGSNIGARLQGGETKSAGTWLQKEAKKGFESCEKAKQWRSGQMHVKFVRISYEIGANFVRISCECHSLANL